MRVLRKLPRSRKPPKPTTAQQRKSRVARTERENARPRAETVTVSDDCCTLPGILWMDQPVPCRHDCHFSDHSFRAGEAVEAVGPIVPADVRGDQALIETACGHCGKVFPSPTLAAVHVTDHKPERLPPTEDRDWPDAYRDGMSWERYIKGPKARKQKVAA